MKIIRHLINKLLGKPQEKDAAPFSPALKPERTILAERREFMGETATRGTVVSMNGNGTIHVQREDEEPYGVLLQDVVDMDLTDMPILCLRDSHMIGGRVSSCYKGDIMLRVDGQAKFGEPLYSYNGTPNCEVGSKLGS